MPRRIELLLSTAVHRCRQVRAAPSHPHAPARTRTHPHPHAAPRYKPERALRRPTSGHCGAAWYRSGYCFSVPSCDKVPAGGNPLNVTSFLVGVSLDDAAPVAQLPLCSMLPSAATNPNHCPWNIQVAA